MTCIKCGGTGILANGEMCDCGVATEFFLPVCMDIPAQYQNLQFDARLVPQDMPCDYGRYISELMRECCGNMMQLCRNILICSPPNTGKTVFAYTVLSFLYRKGVEVFSLRDILEVREVLMNPYRGKQDEVGLLTRTPIAFIKIPLDLPPKLAATMSTVVERRVRHGNSTIFLYGGSKEDIFAQDTFGNLQALLGDGSYNTILVKSWRKGGKES